MDARGPRRSVVVLLLVALVLPAAAPHAVAAGDGAEGGGADADGDDAGDADGDVPVDAAASALFDDLARAARALDGGNGTAAREAVASARDRFNTSIAPASTADPEAMRAALDALDDPVDAGDATALRTAVVAVEAELLALAAANVGDAAPGNEAAVAAWLAATKGRVDAPGRVLPDDGSDGPQAGADPDPDAVLDAVLAHRLLEEVAAAKAARLHDPLGSTVASVHVDRALALWPVVRPRANATLPPAAFDLLDGAMAELDARVADLSPGDAAGLDDVQGPLTVLAYRRAAGAVDIVAAGVEGALFAAHRAWADGAPAADALFEAAFQAYYRHRAFLFREGEAGVGAVDDAIESLDSSVEEGLVPFIEEGVRGTAAALRETALLGYGLVVKVEQVVVSPGDRGPIRVALFHAPVEGVASFELTLGYDPAVAAVRDVRPGRLSDGFAWEDRGSAPSTGAGSAELVLSGGADPPFVGSAMLATVEVEARGAPADQTALRVAAWRFTAGSGDRADVLLLRDGSLRVGGAPSDDGAAAGAGGPSLPALPAAGPARALTVLVLAVTVAALLPRRGSDGEGGPDGFRRSAEGAGGAGAVVARVRSRGAGVGSRAPPGLSPRGPGPSRRSP